MEKAIFFLLLLGCTPLFAQDDDLTALELAVQEDNYRPLTKAPLRASKKADSIETVGRNLDLRSVLEEGFRKNPFEQIRTQRKVW